jgi:mono/diheme cytochrome c family protein
MKSRLLTIIITVSLPLLTACLQERPSDMPPIHLNPNMDSQPKYRAYRESKFFSDQSGMRQPVAGTVAIGNLREDSKYYAGKEANGNFVKQMPVPMNMDLLQRGHERFNIYCSPCHSRVGDGKGIVVQRGMLPPPSFHEARLLAVEDGYIFDVITNGIRNMPSYRHQVSVADRWAIVSYLQALQRSQNAKLSDVPEEMQGQLKAGGQK